MSISAIVMMVIYLLAVWGLLIIAAIYLSRSDDTRSGTLGDQDLDSLPMYSPSTEK